MENDVIEGHYTLIARTRTLWAAVWIIWISSLILSTFGDEVHIYYYCFGAATLLVFTSIFWSNFERDASLQVERLEILLNNFRELSTSEAHTPTIGDNTISERQDSEAPVLEAQLPCYSSLINQNSETPPSYSPV